MDRRFFLRNLLGAGLVPTGLSATGKGRAQGLRVAVLGGGVAGLTAAHELIERGFDVTIFERRPVLGGKARSIDVEDPPPTGGRKPLPGEHGFRFFPGFYRNLPDTLRRIPYQGNALGVYDNLVPTRSILMARNHNSLDVELPTSPPNTPQELRAVLEAIVGGRLGLTLSEQRYFASRMWVFLTSCDERRESQWEQTSWWDFMRADAQSENFRRMTVGLTRSLVAMRSKVGSTRTVASILFQLIQSGLRWSEHLDSVLNGPTNEVWIDPWHQHLLRLGVKFERGVTVRSLILDPSRSTFMGVTCERADGLREASRTSHEFFDFGVACLPLEVLGELTTIDGVPLSPDLERIRALRTDWMAGFQIYLREDIPITRGHIVLVDSPWALTLVSQAQFWNTRSLSGYGAGDVRGIWSIDISDWNELGAIHGKPARECSRQEIEDEILFQLNAHLSDRIKRTLEPSDIVTTFLDPAIRISEDGTIANEEPLLINTTDSWSSRPESRSGVRRLFLASDYVRTSMDLACMESSNEAARRAVNALLDEAASPASRARVYTPKEPRWLLPEKIEDRIRWRQGLNNKWDHG